MERIKKNFGFGFLRLPMQDGEVDIEQTKEMVDIFLESGFNYFDTAHGYLGGRCEQALRASLTSRYPRERYVLANKLSTNYFEKQEDIRPLFAEQLNACGVDYFDFYLMHAQGTGIYEKFKRCRAYETALELQAEGKIRHFGISFHDNAEKLEEILTEYPQIEVVQIQFNYVDYDDPAIQSKALYDVCRKHGKPMLVMEPVKGGNLVNLPQKAQAIFDGLHGGSNASYALRFAAGFDGIFMVLSGMSSIEQMQDNIATMQACKPLCAEEMTAVQQVCAVFRSMHLIACTACRYCTDDCPKHISIPDLFAVMNTRRIYGDWQSGYYYREVYTKDKGKASSCIACGKCEKICPQHLPIRTLLKEVATEFEK